MSSDRPDLSPETHKRLHHIMLEVPDVETDTPAQITPPEVPRHASVNGQFKPDISHGLFLLLGIVIGRSPRLAILFAIVALGFAIKTSMPRELKKDEPSYEPSSNEAQTKAATHLEEVVGQRKVMKKYRRPSKDSEYAFRPYG